MSAKTEVRIEKNFTNLSKNKTVKVRRKSRSGWDSAVRADMYKKTQLCLSCSKLHGVYNTGLSEEERLILEKTMFENPDTYSVYSNFWDKWIFKILGTEETLHLNNPKDYLTYKVLSVHPRVAKKEEDITAETELVLFDEEAEMNAKQLKFQSKQKAYERLSKMSTEEIKNAGLILTNGMGNSDIEVTRLLLNEKLEDDVEGFLAFVNSAVFEDLALAHNLYRKGILQRSSGLLFFGDTSLGKTFEDAAHYLVNPLNNEKKAEMLIKLENSK